MTDHDEWITKHYPTRTSCINKCAVAVRDMTLYFDDLHVQVGTANGVYHCWTIDNNGSIVDPTAKQFKSEIKYNFIADRFLAKDEIELSTGAIFLEKQTGDI